MSFTAAQLGLAVPLRGKRVDYLRLELPYPPAANNLHAVVRGRKILSRAGREYYSLVGLTLKASGHLEGRLFVQIDVYPPDRRRRDLGNTEKAICDALVKAGVFRDDSDIDELRLSRREVVEGGRIRVTLWELTEHEQESNMVI